MKPKHITQKSLQPHLLASMATLVDFTPLRTIRFSETYAPVCARMGITEDAWGTCETHDKPWTHRLIDLAFRTLRDKGLGEYEKKGYWMLTPLGVEKARDVPSVPLHLEDSDETQVAARTLVLAETEEMPMDDEDSGAQVVQIPSMHPYHNDPYIRSLAIAQTACFGAFSQTSKTCSSCPLGGECDNAVDLAMAKIAADMDLAERKIQKKQTEAATSGKSIEELLSSFDDSPADKTSGPGDKRSKMVELVATRTVNCIMCQKTIQKGEKCFWIKGTGILHMNC